MKSLSRMFISSILVALSTVCMAEQPQQEPEPFSQGELEQILAPIALYPDTVLSHILVAATYPIEVVQAERWTTNNSDVSGSEAVEAVEDKDWDPSIKALVAFPDILRRLSENLDWTQKLGDAFLQSEERLLASVQSLRQRAHESGNLDKMEKVSVTHEDDAILIEPVEREIVYVPVYDTRVVYGPWYWSHYPPVYWHSPHYRHHHSPFYWGPRVHVSFGFFFSSFHWHNHHIIRIPSHHYRPHRYYSHHQIVRHQHARRWAHNPSHRRGVSYRSVSVSNRYGSNRVSRNEITSYRDNRRNNDVISRENQARDRNNVRTNERRDTRIASPERIREELRDGRISIEERGSRPSVRTENARTNNLERRGTNRQNNSRVNNSRTRTEASDRVRNNSSGPKNIKPPKAQRSERSRNTVKTPPRKPVKVQKEFRSKEKSSRSSRSSGSNRSSERKSSSKRSSSNRSDRSRGKGNRP